MTEVITSLKTTRYAMPEIEQGLQMLAYCNGMAATAAKNLAQMGMTVTSGTLESWRDRQHTALYDEIRREVIPAIRDRAAELHTEQADRQLEVADRLLERLDKNVGKLNVKDLPQAVKATTISAAANRYKAAMLRQEPTVLTQSIKRDPDEIIRSLKAKGVDPAELLEGKVLSEETLGKDDDGSQSDL